MVDEMVLTGETMRMVSIECSKRKARAVKTACLWAFTELEAYMVRHGDCRAHNVPLGL